MSYFFPGDGIDVHLVEIPHDFEENDGAPWCGSVHVFAEAGAILREDLINCGNGWDPCISLEKAHALMKENFEPSKSFFHHLHASLPDEAVQNIMDFWRTRLAPIYFFEKGDVFMGCSWGERGQPIELFLVARPSCR
jgi:hypothetical protein